MFDDIIRQIDNELALKKMKKISKEIHSGQRKVYSEELVKRKILKEKAEMKRKGLKYIPLEKAIAKYKK